MNREKEIQKISEDISDLIDYDEWSAREYGETNVDIYGTALNLYNAGYRKADDVRREVIVELEEEYATQYDKVYERAKSNIWKEVANYGPKLSVV